MIFWSRVTLLFFLPLISAFPLLQRSSLESCSQYDSIPASDTYSVLTNFWGKNYAPSGSQCTRLISYDGESLSWLTTWKWTGSSNQVKSFSNAQLNVGLNQQLSAISSMLSDWTWAYTNTESIVADVAYDFFTSWGPGGQKANELMIWLANFNSGAISFNYDESGAPIPVATDLSFCGHEWNFYHGYNGYNQVYSFVPVNGQIRSFSGDTFEFFQYLIGQGYIPDSQYLIVAQAGTEATSGSGTFETSSYSLEINPA